MRLPTEDSTATVAEGSTLKGPYWPEPVQVLSVQVRNRRIEIHAVGLQTEQYFSNLLERAFQEENRNVQLALTVLQRRLASSLMYALVCRT